MAKIMLIEDDKLVSRSLELVLTKAGHTIIIALNGEIGVAKFSTEKPDLVITDIVMPDKDGIQTIREIRQLSEDVPIIAISGGGRTRNFDFLRVANNMGATDVLRKPFYNEALVALVEQHLKGRPTE